MELFLKSLHLESFSQVPMDLQTQILKLLQQVIRFQWQKISRVDQDELLKKFGSICQQTTTLDLSERLLAIYETLFESKNPISSASVSTLVRSLCFLVNHDSLVTRVIKIFNIFLNQTLYTHQGLQSLSEIIEDSSNYSHPALLRFSQFFLFQLSFLLIKKKPLN